MGIEDKAAVRRVIDIALEEDLGGGPDVTTDALVPESAVVTAVVLAREPLVVSGGGVAAAVFTRLDARIECTACLAEGADARPDEAVLRLRGPARGILTAERTALNFMQRMSGIATLTRTFVDKARAHGVEILDTRKTTPGLRALEKYAVLCGGGTNHRMGLFDRVLIKDNHRRLWQGADPSALDRAVHRARQVFPGPMVEVEVENVTELESALAAAPEWILLDNMDPQTLADCVRRCAGRCKLEASGGITLENIEEVAASGIDAISLGCLTHSARSMDLSLEIEETP